MKRLYIAVVLLVIIAITVAVGITTVRKSEERISDIISEIETTVKKGDNEKAVILCDKAEQKWVELEDTLTLIVNHTDLSEIGVAISSLKPLIEHDEKAEFFSRLNEVRVMLRHLAAMESIVSD